MKIVIVCVLLVVLAVLTAIPVASVDGFVPGANRPIAYALGAGWVVAISAFAVLLRIKGRAATVLVFAGSVLLSVAALAGPPNQSTDSARYAWDGIVQGEGHSPYAYVPASDALTSSRPAWLFPETSAGSAAAPCSDVRIDGTTRFQATSSVPEGDLICTAINRPTVPTIYPPVAEGFFFFVRSFVPATAEYWPLQVAGLVLSLATTALLSLGLRRRALDSRWAAVWGWSPFVAAEAVTNSHVDVLGVVLIVGATLLTPWRIPSEPMSTVRAVLIGVGVGLAAATKFVPAIAGLPLARQRPILIGGVAAATFISTYVPYLVLSGSAVLGFLPGYLNEEGYDTGARFALLAPLNVGSWATPIAGLLVAVILLLGWRRTDIRAPWHAQVVIVGMVLLVTSPFYAWYALLVIPFVVLSRRWEWLAVPLALSFRSIWPETGQGTLLLLGAALFTTAMTIWRTRRDRQRADNLPVNRLRAPTATTPPTTKRKATP